MTTRRTCQSCGNPGDASKGVQATTRGRTVWKCQSCCDLMTARKAGRYVSPPRPERVVRGEWRR